MSRIAFCSCGQLSVTVAGEPTDVRVCHCFECQKSTGELDDISGLGQTKAAHHLCARIPAARRRHLEQEGVGHYGIFTGRKWRQFIYPAWAEFVRATS